MNLRSQPLVTFFIKQDFQSGSSFWIYFILAIQFLTTSVHTCVFPDYVQNTVNGIDNVRDWKGEIRDQNRRITLRYVFSNDIMQVESFSAKTDSYSRLCVQHIGSDKFLVAHEQDGQANSKYTCMQFLRRENAVLQIRQAALSDQLSSNLCERNNLKLDGWVILDYNAKKKKVPTCPLVGGFNMQVYDKSSNTALCDAYLGETRLESECLPGEGMHFYFRQVSCVPGELRMYPEQRTYCIVHWVAGKYNFILLSSGEDMTYLWILRYPQDTISGLGFTALLMMDLYATKENSIRVTSNYLSLTMSRQNPKTLDHLCYDDYEICSVLSDPCSYSEDMARTCAKTCGFCTETSPTTCNFNLPINGNWIDSNQPETRPNVNTNATVLEITGIETLHCIRWSPPVRRNARPRNRYVSSFSNSASQYNEQMLVSVSENGCRPRFTCAKFSKMPDVFFMQLSQTKLWPIVETKNDAYDCSRFKYESNVILDDNPYRTNDTNLLLPHITNSVHCDLSRFMEFTATFGEDTRCVGNLYQNHDKTSLEFDFEHCPHSSFSLEHICLDFSNFPPTPDILLVTKASESQFQIYCWLIPFEAGDTIYVVEAKDCNYATHQKIKEAKLLPIVTLTKGKHTFVETTSNIDINVTKTSVIIDALSSTTTSAVVTVADDNSNNTDPNSKPENTDSKVAAGAGVLITIGLVVSMLICKCLC